jgi:hypothetical protein
MKSIVAALLTMLLPSLVFAAEARSYLCIADKATGFKYDRGTKQWDYAQFRPEGFRYILKVSASEKWELLEFGKPDDESSTFSECTGTKVGGELGGELVVVGCTGYNYFRFIPGTSRFTLSFFGGFNTHTDEAPNTDTPSLAIGRCSRV